MEHHMNVARLFALAASLALPSLAWGQGQARSSTAPSARVQADLLDRAVKAWAKVRTARATFEQSITNPLTGRTMTTTAEFQQQRPGKLSVRFADPANDRIVADGKYVWLYLPSTAPGQVIRSTAAGGSGSVDFTAQFLTDPRSRYTVTPAGTMDVAGRATHGFTLVPKKAQGAPFQAATVWIDDVDATVRRFVITEGSGVQRTVRLTSFRTNVPVDASAFRFTVPAGVRVVEQ
jgi:outer membrane lipoprotein carrier protein